MVLYKLILNQDLHTHVTVLALIWFHFEQVDILISLSMNWYCTTVLLSHVSTNGALLPDLKF